MSGIDSIFSGFSAIDDDFYEEIEETLIMGDLGIQTTMSIVEDLRAQGEGAAHQGSGGVQGASDRAASRSRWIWARMPMSLRTASPWCWSSASTAWERPPPSASWPDSLKDHGQKVILAAADTFRAAAIEQLTEWANRAGVDIIAQQEGSDPAAVVYDAVSAAKSRNADVLICDTAGRLHNKKNLMEELKKINRIIDKEYPDAYRETLVVLDGTTGQNALAQARQFMEVADITGIILTKLDGTAKGGIAVAIQSELGIPVKYIGIGEKIDDLQKFDADDFVNALFQTKYKRNQEQQCST